MEHSTNDLERERKGRVQLLHKATQGECTEGYSGQWLAFAEEVLERNGINAQYFARCVLELLQKGMGKYCNFMIAEGANCGKTFLLNPLTCNKIFRWSPKVISSRNFFENRNAKQFVT